jgi:Ca-activated chloride channel family protein
MYRHLLPILLLAACGADDMSAGQSNEADASTSRPDVSSDTGSWSGPDTGVQDTSSTQDGSWGSDAGPTADATADTGGGNTNISFGGAQDFGHPRALIENGQVPHPRDLEPAGFFAEHSTPLPQPTCGRRMCVQAMLGVFDNLLTGTPCTLLQLGLNSPIEVDPGDRPPLTLAVAVDVSGSMQAGDKIGFVRTGLERLVSELHDDDQLAIVTYSDVVEVAWPMQTLRGNRNALLTLVRGIDAGGATDLHGGLMRAYEAVADAWDSGRQNRVILLSDGQPTAGITDTAAILDDSGALNSDGIGLTTVGLGLDFNVTLMRGLAEQADGNFYFLESSSAVDEVFTEELAYFTLPVAFDVTLDVRSGDLYELVRAYGSSRFAVDDGGGTFEVPSVFFAHRQAHDDVFEGEGRRGGGSMLVLELMPRVWDGEVAPTEADVASVSLTFREPGTNEVLNEELVVHYPYAPDHVVPTGFFDNTIVTKSFVVLNLYFAIEDAALKFHGGRAREARDVLARVIDAAIDYEDSANGGTGDVDIRLDIELMEAMLANIETLGRLNEPPPPPANDPWPCD